MLKHTKNIPKTLTKIKRETENKNIKTHYIIVN